MINIINKTNSVVLIDSNNGTKYYEIEKRRFEETIEGNLSDWILQLSNNSWLKDDTHVLYELANIICKECPKNTIDWYNTFFVVEKLIYLKTLADGLLSKTESRFANLIKGIEFNKEQSTPENHKIIEEIVSEKLKAYNLN